MLFLALFGPFACVLGLERNPTPFEHLELLQGLDGHGKIRYCAFPLMHVRGVVHLVT